MKKKYILPILLSGLLLASCGTNADDSPSSSSPSEVEPAPVEKIITGRGKPSNTDGAQYSLYVDSETNMIYEKNKAYAAPSSSLKRAADESKWIYTNCKAGANFTKESPVADALRNALLSTNVTLKANDHTVFNQGSFHMDNTSVAYIAYNVGNVLFKSEEPGYEGFDNAIIRAYSLYDIDNDSYKFYMNEGSSFVDRTSYINDGDPSHEGLVSRFITRCFNNYLELSCNFPLCDKILEELDNFTVYDKVYTLPKDIVGTSDIYTNMYGEGEFKFSNLSFKLSSDGSSLDYFEFRFSFETNDKSVSVVEDLHIEVTNLRTTSFAIPQ